MHGRTAFKAAVLLVAIAAQICLARNILPFGYKSPATLPASIVEGPQVATNFEAAERLNKQYAEMAKQAQKERFQAAYQAQVDKVEAQTNPLLDANPLTSSNNLNDAVAENNAALISKRSQRTDGSEGPDSRPEWMKSMTAGELREAIIYIRKTLNNITFENRKAVTVQGYTNLMFEDYHDGCRSMKRARNHFFLYHPLFQTMFPEWEESFLFYVETPWLITYPKRLRKLFKEAGFKEADYHPSCEMWREGSRTVKDGVTRGSFSYKVPKGFDWEVETYLQLNDQFELIEDVLEDVYPGVEIALILLGSLLGGIILFVLGRWIMKKKGWDVKLRKGYHRKRASRRAEDDEVELRPSPKCSKCSADINIVEQF